MGQGSFDVKPEVLVCTMLAYLNYHEPTRLVQYRRKSSSEWNWIPSYLSCNRTDCLRSAKPFMITISIAGGDLTGAFSTWKDFVFRIS